jgi:hypothetical protein
VLQAVGPPSPDPLLLPVPLLPIPLLPIPLLPTPLLPTPLLPIPLLPIPLLPMPLLPTPLLPMPLLPMPLLPIPLLPTPLLPTPLLPMPLLPTPELPLEPALPSSPLSGPVVTNVAPPQLASTRAHGTKRSSERLPIRDASLPRASARRRRKLARRDGGAVRAGVAFIRINPCVRMCHAMTGPSETGRSEPGILRQRFSAHPLLEVLLEVSCHEDLHVRADDLGLRSVPARGSRSKVNA